MEDKPTLQANWRELELSQIGSILTGKTPSTKNSGNFGDGTPFITPSDIADQRYIVHTSRCITEQGLKEVKSLRVPPETIIVPCIGYIGKVSISGQESVTNQQINSIIPNPEFNSLYIYYSLKSIMEGIGYSISGGSVVPIINKTTFSKLTIRVPSRHHQDVIANILGSLDDKIELNRQINEKLEGIAQALFKSWFVDFDPVRAKAEGRDTGLPEHISSLFPASFVDSEMGQIPEGWKKTTLGEICHKPQYGYTDSAQVEEIGPKFLRITDINKEAWIDWSKVPYCSPEEEDHVRYRLHMGDIVIARMADPGHGAMIEESIDAVYASYLIRFVPKKKEYSRYLQYWLKSTVYWQIVNARKTGTTRANINAQDMSGFPLLLPPEGILAQFSDKTSSIRDSGIKHIEESSVLRRFRDTLLPKLISGELPIPDAERIVGRYL